MPRKAWLGAAVTIRLSPGCWAGRRRSPSKRASGIPIAGSTIVWPASDAADRRQRLLRMRHSIGEDSAPCGNSPRLALVTTTIRIPEVLRLYRALAPEIAIFIVGDRRSPHAQIRALAG